MITLATISDQMRDGERRAAGRKVRHVIAVCVDNYNIVLAEKTGDNPLQGRKYFHNLTGMAKLLREFGCDDEEILHGLRKGLARLDSAAKKMSIEEMDQHFRISERTDDSSGKLSLYNRLKKAGFTDDEDKKRKKAA